MTTLEDKILGIKKDYYCSSSESEGDESDGSDDGKEITSRPQGNAPASDVGKWEGASKNTGPKGVLKDWEDFKQLQQEKYIDRELQNIQLAKKLTLSGNTNPDDIDPELMELTTDDEFLLEYQKKRMVEMMNKPIDLPKFGSLIALRDGNEFLEAIDNEDKLVIVIIHIYEEAHPGCKTMNKCLESLCKQYPSVKFCKFLSSSAGMSLSFKMEGVPALLVYKEGGIIGNFIRLTDEFGDEFYDSDIENFLIEHGILSDRYCVPTIIEAEDKDDGNGSDWSLE